MKVKFVDQGNVNNDPEKVTFAVGIVNGESITNPDTGDKFLPVWTERDNGREATTIYVNEKNIVGRES